MIAALMTREAPRELQDRFQQSSTCFGLRFSVPQDARDLSDLYREKLGEWEIYRGTEQEADRRLAPRTELEQLCAGVEDFLRRFDAETYVLFRSEDRAELKALRRDLVALKLQTLALQRLFGLSERKNRLSPSSLDSLKDYLAKACEEHMVNHRRPRLTDQDLDRLYQTYERLPDTHQADRLVMLQTIQTYRALKINSTTQPSADPIQRRASQLWLALKSSYADAVPLLLQNSSLRQLFEEQVIRDRLSLEVFFRHPFVARFLRQAESLEQSVALAGDRIRVGATNLAEIRVDGAWAPVRDLPGYRSGFRNLHGWVTLGLEHSKAPQSLSLAIEKSVSEDSSGFVYTKEKGLVSFNPRTWARKIEGQWQMIDLEQSEWWRQLPVYKTELVELADVNDSGWRLEWLVNFNQETPQIVNTHAFQCVVIPLEEPVNGRVRVGYYPFGTFAYVYKGISHVLSRMAKELHYLDQSLHYTDRSFESYQQVISREEGLRVMEQLRRERRDSLAEACGTQSASFWLPENNCSTSVRRVAAAAGPKYFVPLATPVSGLSTGFQQFLLSVLTRIEFIRRILFWLIGASATDRKWDGVTHSTYTMRMYLQMRREIDERVYGVDTIARQRIPLLSLAS